MNRLLLLAFVLLILGAVVSWCRYNPLPGAGDYYLPKDELMGLNGQ